ncbi:amidohydrolase family protein [Microbulbifer sp. OS29]|uniref:Amidohydrolase family protein n=1 Tax=Microbulbifer okhotskensis TaxID=2926617 RepID=A0A9X2ELL6_9GAMM|nr:amidohydrolase family protein [Microbulbifer okhotskensis]MCO1334489.1 amidohydrolase family protein [Microbulbifer okhotskensis]
MRKNILAALIAATVLTAANSVSAKSIEYVFYDKEGIAGTEIIEQEGSKVSGELKLGWNNRRLNLKESFTIGDAAIPERLSIEGVSPFGAPVSEEYSIENGIARWQGSDEHGSAKTSEAQFYIPKNSTLAVQAQLVKALLADADQNINLLPQGNARLHKLDQLTLQQDGEKKTIYLYGISGLGFTPDLAWYDESGNLFAADEGGWFAILRKGWDKSHLEALKTRQVAAADQYLQELAEKHTHTSTQPVLISNVNLVDIKAGKLQKKRHVLVENGKIAQISKKPIKLKGATIIDARGHTLIPGLWDMHAHLSPTDGTLNMAAGIINVRDIGNTHENISRISGLFESEQIIGGDLFRAGFMDRESENSMRMGKTADSLEEAKEIVEWYAERGYQQIKTYSSMEPEWIAPLAKHIHENNMRLSGHIPAFMTAEEAVDAGFDEIQHINMLFLNFMGKIDTRKKLRFTELGEHGHELDLNSKAVAVFLDKLAKKGTVVDATTTVFSSMLLRQQGKVDPEFADITEHLPVNIQRHFVGAELDVKPEHRDDYDLSAKALLEMMRKLYEHKVTMVAGSDGIPGFTLLRELELYAKAGIPNIDVLRTATLVPAQVMGADQYTGSIEVGKNADLVLLEGNPLEDITALRRTALVLEGQNLYRPDELYTALGIKPFHPSVPFELNSITTVVAKSE